MHRLVCLFLLAGSASAAVPLTYYQDWFPGPQFAGLYEALDQGFYAQSGLELRIHPFAFGQDVPALIDLDPSRAGVATMEGYILLQKRAKGADLRVLNAVLRESPAGYMSLPGRSVHSARDFVGKRVGVHKFGDPLYRLFLQRAGVNPAFATMIFVDDDIRRLERGEVDLMQGYAIEELVKLRRQEGPSAGFLSFRELGFDAYSQVIFSTAAQVKTHLKELSAFVAATRQGWIYARVHPDDAVHAVLRRVPAGTDRALLRAMLDATQPYISAGGDSPLGPMDPAKWNGMEKACVEMGLIAEAEDPAAFVVPGAK